MRDGKRELSLIVRFKPVWTVGRDTMGAGHGAIAKRERLVTRPSHSRSSRCTSPGRLHFTLKLYTTFEDTVVDGEQAWCTII